ncbi:cupin-like domain-containing protein [Enhygromyxa salina]|uniref:JmjC domain-containing protein n=1 Tax=Enhygromyxa salina TaxID=215803 RepID=A0A2S9YPE2_9BACT|nr:cupin-like domain-containing protein [Enhygromyxa salina]PRQ06954.1 hypothetical protein ENSA7_33780 [Enhygromyxa salina]
MSDPSSVIEAVDTVPALLEHVDAGRPALFDAALLGPRTTALVGSWSALCDAAEPWAIPVRPNYRDHRFAAFRDYLRTRSEPSLAGFGPLPAARVELRDYIEQAQARPDQTDPAVELRPSARLLEHLDGPAPLFEAMGLTRLHPGKTDDADAIVVYAYVAGADQSSDLHFDRDGRHVFNVQLIGRKRFVLFSPHAGPLLSPIMQFSGIRAREWSPSQRRDFLAYAGGCEVVLEPGWALYMPPFYWHHIDYLDAAAGLGFRVRPPDPGLQRVLDRLPANYLLQTIAAELLARDDEPARQCRAELEAFVDRGARSVAAAYEAACALQRRCLATLGVELCGGGSPVIDSLDFGAPLFRQFMAGLVDDAREPSLALAPELRFAPLDRGHVALVHGERSVPVPLALGRALLGRPRFDLDVLIAEHPEISATRWTRTITKLRERGFIVALDG